MIEFQLDETQSLLKQTVQTFAIEVLRPEARKAEAARDLPEGVLSRYMELGLSLDEFPEELGGGGLDLNTVLIAAEELGYGDLGIAAALPHPGPAGWILYRLGNEEQKQMLTPLAQKPSRGLLLFNPWMCVEEWDPFGLPLQYETLPSGYHIYGHYPLAFGVDRLAFAVALARKNEGEEVRAFLLEPEDLKIGSRKELCGAEVAHVAEIEIDRELPPNRVLEGDVRSALKEALTRQRLRTAAMILGASRAAWDEAVEYAQVREAFGKKIAEFQAVAFMIANAAIDLEGSRNLLWYAGWSLARGKPDAERLAAEAVIHTYLSADRITSDCLQIFGGNGYVQDYPLEKFMRDVRTVSLVYGARPYLDSAMIPETMKSWVKR